MAFGILAVVDHPPGAGDPPPPLVEEKPAWPADPDAPVLRDPHPPRLAPPPSLSNWPAADEDPAVDVLHYDLDLDFEIGGKEIAGRATLTLAWGSDPDSILTLDLAQAVVTGVQDGGASPLPFTVGGSTLDIALPWTPARGETVVVAVDYEIVNSSSYTVGANASFTFTEPNGSRYWFPCRDVPWDKATVAVHAKVPVGDRAVSNGLLDSMTLEGANTVYHWREDHPIATYLIAVAVAGYAEVVPPQVPITPTAWYVYPGHELAAQSAFANVGHMVTTYDSLLAPYPFDKYTMVEGNFGGGMEHQTCTLIGQIVVTGNKTYEWITAHELAHQWFGDLVTLLDWRHIWLNEGFATFYDAVWHEVFYGEATFLDRMAENESSVLSFEGVGSNRYPIIDPPAGSLFNTLVYKKGAWVLYMLRTLLGPGTYDAAVSEYLATHAYGNADTDDLKTVMEARSGQDLDWYFNQWLYGSGSPRLSYFAIYDRFGDHWTTQLDIRQIQPTATVFRLPLHVRVGTVAGPQDFFEWVETQHEIFQFDTVNQPISVELDPDNLILGNMEIALVVDAEPVLPAPRALRTWPNPFRHRLQVAGAEPGPRAQNVDIFDPRGRRIRGLGAWSPDGAPLWWDARDDEGRDAPPGVYFVRVRETGEATRIVLLP